MFQQHVPCQRRHIQNFRRSPGDLAADFTTLHNYFTQVRHVQSAADMQAMMEQKDCFMACMSHELRTPLNGIISLTEGLLKGTFGLLSDATRRQLHTIRMSGLRLLSIVNGIMDSSALRSGRLKIREDVVNVYTTCQDVMGLMRHLTQARVFIVNALPRFCMIKGDRDRLVQIFNNLLGNAAKFTKAGEIRITAEYLAKEGMWAISVSDTGIGIRTEKLSTIFSAFEQVCCASSRRSSILDSAPCRRTHGTSLAHHLVSVNTMKFFEIARAL
jgi:signal transduction histidine kinase